MKLFDPLVYFHLYNQDLPVRKRIMNKDYQDADEKFLKYV